MTQETESMSIADRVFALVDSGEFELPAFPAVALRLQQALADDNTDVGDVVKLLRQEPAIAASILRCANSAVYGGLSTITDLGQAVARLGMKRIGTIVTTLQMKGKFESDNKDSRERLSTLWNASIATATVCQALSSRDGLDEDQAFLGGLLHGIGRLIALKAVDQIRAAESELQVTDVVLNELMAAMYADLGHRTLVSWGLPEDICRAPKALELKPEGHADRPILILQASDCITRKLGYHPEPDPEMRLSDQEAVEELELKDIELATLMVELEDEIQKVKGLF